MHLPLFKTPRVIVSDSVDIFLTFQRVEEDAGVVLVTIAPHISLNVMTPNITALILNRLSPYYFANLKPIRLPFVPVPAVLLMDISNKGHLFKGSVPPRENTLFCRTVSS